MRNATTRQSSADGKGSTLARLYQAGYPVPDGFVILSAAFTGDKLTPEAWTQVQTHLRRMGQANNETAFAVRSSALSEDSASNLIIGAAGAAGRIEGPVRCLDSLEKGDQLQPGEILVTAQTNIGWTLLFPRAAAIVTDVGAPLSHAAIVARELGIPAVVGCGNATLRLRTGDWVLVDGGRRVVEINESATISIHR